MQTWKDEVQRESFVNNELLEKLLVETKGCSDAEFEAVMKRAENQARLTLEEVAILLNTEDKAKIKRIFLFIFYFAFAINSSAFSTMFLLPQKNGTRWCNSVG